MRNNTFVNCALVVLEGAYVAFNGTNQMRQDGNKVSIFVHGTSSGTPSTLALNASPEAPLLPLGYPPDDQGEAAQFPHRITGGLMGVVACEGGCVSGTGLKCTDVELCAVDARDWGTVVELTACSMAFKPTSQHLSPLNPHVSCIDVDGAVLAADPGSGFARTGVAARRGASVKLHGLRTAGASVGLLVQNSSTHVPRSAMEPVAQAIAQAQAAQAQVHAHATAAELAEMDDRDGAAAAATAVAAAAAALPPVATSERRTPVVEAIGCHFSSGTDVIRCDEEDFWLTQDFDSIPGAAEPAYVSGTVHGVAVYGAFSDVYVCDCVSDGAQIAGFWVQDGGRLHIEGEIICLSDADRVGCCVMGENTTLEACNLVVESCHNDGVVVLRGARASLHHCRIESCRVNAMRVFDRAKVALMHCTLENWKRNGLYVMAESEARAEFCQITGDGNSKNYRGSGERRPGDGVVAHGPGSSVLMYACKSTGNFDSGMFAENGGNMHCMSCVSGHSHHRDGVYGGTLRLQNCAIIESGAYDIRCRGRNSVVVRKAGFLVKDQPADQVQFHKNDSCDAHVVGVSVRSAWLGCVFVDMLVTASDESDSGRVALGVRDYEANAARYADALMHIVSMAHDHVQPAYSD